MTEAVSLRPSARRLSSADYCTKAGIVETLTSAQAAADKIRAAAEKEASERRAALEQELEAYQAAALAKADEEAADQRDAKLNAAVTEGLSDLVELGQAIEKDFQASEVWLAELVQIALKKILGTLDPDAIDLALIKTAIHDFGKRWRYDLIVAPGDQARVEQMVATAALSSVQAVTVDPDLPLGTLRLASAAGVVDATLAVQLEQVEACLQSKSSSGVSA